MSGDRPTADDRPAGTVLITVDCLRADALADVAATGDSPALARLCERATVFERAVANGNWTPFSFPSLLGADHVFAADGEIGVAPGPTLAEALSAEGITTAGFNAANGFLTPHWGYDRGFDQFRSFTSSSGPVGRFLTTHPTVQAWVEFAAAPLRRTADRVAGRDVERGRNTSRLADVERAAVEFLESATENRPFFLWIHYMDAHTPYVPAPRYVPEVSGRLGGTLRMLRAHARAGLGRDVTERTLADLRALYRGAIRQIDDSVGRVLAALERQGLREETCVVLAGDHGEEFGEHGHLAHYPKLYDELVHVPLVVDHPDGTAGRLSETVGLDAVPATIADAMGADAGPFRGESLLETVVSGERPPDGPVHSVAVRGDSVTAQPIPRRLADGELLVSARTREWTYVRHTDSGRTELYDRRVDPGEQHDVWEMRGHEPEPRRLADATERYARRVGGADADGATADDGDEGADAVPAEIEDQLRALGYS
ncbi:MAG: sulfatase-like hydrolase/transferase [Haloarculaceae archaeon]